MLGASLLIAVFFSHAYGYITSQQQAFVLSAEPNNMCHVLLIIYKPLSN